MVYHCDHFIGHQIQSENSIIMATKWKWKGLPVTRINPAASVYNDIRRRTQTIEGYQPITNKNAIKLTEMLVNRVNRLRKQRGLEPIKTPNIVFAKRNCCEWIKHEFHLVNNPIPSTVVHELCHKLHMDGSLSWMIPTAERHTGTFDCHGDRFVRYMTTLGDIMVKQKSFDKFMVKC